MDVFDYIAVSNPVSAKTVIESRGYRCIRKDMAQNLRDLVNMEGEGAMLDVLSVHPDKEVLLDHFSKEGAKQKSNKKGCQCGGDRQSSLDALLFLNAAGNANAAQSQKQNSNGYGNMMGMAIIACSLMLSVAILAQKK